MTLLSRTLACVLLVLLPGVRIAGFTEVRSVSPLAAKKATSVKLAYMRPLTHTAGVQEDLAVRMALDAINADATVLPTTELVLLASDTKCDNQVATKEMISHLTITGNAVGIAGIIGGLCSGCSERIASIAALYNIVQISGASLAPSLSDKSKYPYVRGGCFVARTGSSMWCVGVGVKGVGRGADFGAMWSGTMSETRLSSHAQNADGCA